MKRKVNRKSVKKNAPMSNDNFRGIDLFEDYENIPPRINAIIERYQDLYGEDLGGMDYKDTARMLEEFEQQGYTFDYYLDNQPYGLRPIGVKLNELKGFEEFGDDEYGGGGETPMARKGMEVEKKYGIVKDLRTLNAIAKKYDLSFDNRFKYYTGNAYEDNKGENLPSYFQLGERVFILKYFDGSFHPFLYELNPKSMVYRKDNDEPAFRNYPNPQWDKDKYYTKFSEGGGVESKYSIEQDKDGDWMVVNNEKGMYVDRIFNSQSEAENFIRERNFQRNLVGFESYFAKGGETPMARNGMKTETIGASGSKYKVELWKSFEDMREGKRPYKIVYSLNEQEIRDLAEENNGASKLYQKRKGKYNNFSTYLEKGGQCMYGLGGKVDDIDSEISSNDLKEELREKMKDGDDVIHFAYTDYGGDFLDKVAIEYFEENYPKNIVSEDTAYSGKNAFVFGKPATEWLEASQNYLLGFDDIEEYYYQRQTEVEYEGYNDFLKDLRMRYVFDKNKVLNWLMENRSGYYTITTQGLDYSTDDLIEVLENEGLIKKSKEYGGGGETPMARNGMKVQDYYEVYDEESGITLNIYAYDLKNAEMIASDLDFSFYEDGDYVGGDINPNEDDEYKTWNEAPYGDDDDDDEYSGYAKEKRYFLLFQDTRQDDSFAQATTYGYNEQEAEENARYENDLDESWELYSIKTMANGGTFGGGGSIAEGNYHMILSQAKEVQHHVSELQDILKKEDDIEAWVVAKMQDVSSTLSDVTHYLDGKSEIPMAKRGMKVANDELPTYDIHLDYVNKSDNDFYYDSMEEIGEFVNSVATEKEIDRYEEMGYDFDHIFGMEMSTKNEGVIFIPRNEKFRNKIVEFIKGKYGNKIRVTSKETTDINLNAKAKRGMKVRTNELPTYTIYLNYIDKDLEFDYDTSSDIADYVSGLPTETQYDKFESQGYALENLFSVEMSTSGNAQIEIPRDAKLKEKVLDFINSKYKNKIKVSVKETTDMNTNSMAKRGMKVDKIEYPSISLKEKDLNDDQTEIYAYIETRQELQSQYDTIRKNLMTKIARGEFDETKAPKLFMYLVENGLKLYSKNFGEISLSKQEKEEIANNMVVEFMSEAELGNYENETFLPKKYLAENGMVVMTYDVYDENGNCVGYGMMGQDVVDYANLLWYYDMMDEDGEEIDDFDVAKDYLEQDGFNIESHNPEKSSSATKKRKIIRKMKK